MLSSFPLLAAGAHEVWQSLLDVLLLLGLAMVLGSLAERLRQSAIVGYLLAGTIVGPGALGWVSNQQDIFHIAELGVAMLLFAIGLEFSPRRLLNLGRTPLLAGPLQVIATLIVGATFSWALGMNGAAALVIGSMVALSSTACVLRILMDRAEIDTLYGRISLGVLLIQDMAVVPLMLLVTILSTGGTLAVVVWRLTLALGSAAVLIAAFYAVFNYLAPAVLKSRTLRRNRDLPILLAVVMALGSAWVAQHFDLSPALGAFVAGVLLAVSPFAIQIRADIEPVKTILVTLFFAAVGMFGDVAWLIEHIWLVGAVVAAIVLGKAVLVAAAVQLSGGRAQFAFASALCLAQVGEFSFVLATIARADAEGNGVLSDTAFRAIVSATIISLLTTPYLIAIAPRAGAWLERCLQGWIPASGTAAPKQAGQLAEGPDEAWRSHQRIVIIGFGPAGQRAAEDLIAVPQLTLVVIDINPENIEVAKRYGFEAHIGDATQTEILLHAGISQAHLVIITIPSPQTARNLVHLARYHASDAIIFARARYHIHRWQLAHAGAHVVVDEEDRVGHELAAKVLSVLNEQEVD